eukprot:7880538-Pyramimonas_sp.AAC.1
MPNRGYPCVLPTPNNATRTSSGVLGPYCRRKSLVSCRVSCPIKSDCKPLMSRGLVGLPLWCLRPTLRS